jgi:uncharacterized protein (TIGR02391 family)
VVYATATLGDGKPVEARESVILAAGAREEVSVDVDAAASLADEIRRRTGRNEDGVQLVDAVFEGGQRGAALMALTAMTTSTEKSCQRGLADALRGVFASLRNPTAHEPKIHSTMTEQDALDELSHMSYLHRRVDDCKS